MLYRERISKNKNNFKMNNENDMVCKTIFNDNNNEPAFKKDFY